MNYEDFLSKLLKEELFINWTREHNNNFLSHLFVQVDGSLEMKSPWEIGYFDQDNKKITVFTEYEGKSIIKPADEVFKKESDEVERLAVDSVKISLEDAKVTCLKELPEKFPGEIFGDGFLILQCWQKEIVWNFTLITKTLKFANIKISADSGKVTEHQAVDLVQK